jgi:hypothetical protein
MLGSRRNSIFGYLHSMFGVGRWLFDVSGLENIER